MGRSLELVMLLLVAVLLFINQWHMTAMHSLLPMVQATEQANSNGSLAGSEMLPHGVPDHRYGSELGLNFDDAAKAIAVLENFDRGSGAITLTGELKQRYIDIASQTSCEFCCGAKTLVFPDGKPACGCAHSAAMRGVALYLLQNYPQMGNSEILGEVNRWKAAFFPGPTVNKAGAGANQTAAPSGSLPSQVGGC